MSRVRYPTGAELRSLDQREASLRAADRLDGGRRYRTFRAEQDRLFRAALVAGRRRGRAS